MVDLKKFVEEIVNLMLLEVQELKIILKDEYGIELVVGGVVMMVGLVVGVVEVVEEKIEFDVVLIDVGVNKINVIKEVCGIIGLGLKEVKDLVEVGGKVKEGVLKVDVEEMKKKLEVVGVKVELK